MYIAAVDAGRSAIKCVLAHLDNPNERTRVLFPNATMPAVRLSDAATQERAALNTVTVKGQQLFFGETALAQSAPTSLPLGLTDEWFFGQDHLAVLFGGLKRLRAQAPNFDTSACQLVLGLPATLFTTRAKEYRAFIRENTRSGDCQVPERNIHIHAQPWGALYASMLDPNGYDSGVVNPATQTWAVLELGHYTTDFLVISNGDIIERTVGSCSGVSVVADELINAMRAQSVLPRQESITAALANAPVKRYGELISFTDARATGIQRLTTELNREARARLEPFMQSLDGILLAGGGAALVEDWATTLGPPVHVVDDPRFAVAEGFARFGLAKNRLSLAA